MKWTLACGRPIAEAGGGSAPQQEIKLKSCLSKVKFFLPILIIFTEASNDSGLLKLGMPFLKKKLIIRIYLL